MVKGRRGSPQTRNVSALLDATVSAAQARSPRATPPSSSASTPESAEPFTLELRRDAESALVLGEPIGRGAMGVVKFARAGRRPRRAQDDPYIHYASWRAPRLPAVGGRLKAVQAVPDEVSARRARGVPGHRTLHDAFEDEAGAHLLIDLCESRRPLTTLPTPLPARTRTRAARRRARPNCIIDLGALYVPSGPGARGKRHLTPQRPSAQ